MTMKSAATKSMALLVSLLAGSATAPAQFSTPRRAYTEYLVTTDHPSRLYKSGEEATVRVDAFKGGLPLDSVWLHYKTGDEMMAPEKTDSVMFHDGKAEISLGTRETPGFRECRLKFKVFDKEYSDLVKVGFDADKISSFTEEPEDFDRFWAKTLREAEKTDIAAEITPLPEKSTETVEVSLVKINVGPGGRHFYGYLTRPRDGKKHPVLFSPPGAGASRTVPFHYYSDMGFIYLNVNIHNGCNPELSEEDFNKAQKEADGYPLRGIDSQETFYYKDVYAGCSRCVDFLCTLPDWDGKNVGVTGGSQGGALSMVTAALNPKVTFCSPFYPALCDLNGFLHDRAGGWPKYFRNDKGTPGAEATLRYYDVVNFAKRIECPVFYSFGYNDETCSPTSVYAAYNAITAPKVLEVTPSSGHWRFPESNERSVAWMKRMAGI